MTFTTKTVVSVEQSPQQFRGIFGEVWKVKLTVDPASIAAAAEDIATFAVPGVALGDMVIGWSSGVDLTVDAAVAVYVSAADVVSIRISNLHASSALDLATSTWKVVIGRPVW